MSTATKAPTSRLELLHALANVKRQTTITYRDMAVVIRREPGGWGGRFSENVFVSIPGIDGQLPASNLTQRLEAINSIDTIIRLIEER